MPAQSAGRQLKASGLAEKKAARWTSCSLTSEPLKSPASADFLGNLFNREAVLRFLLARKGKFEDEATLYAHMNLLQQSGMNLDHLQNKRDVFAVHLQWAQDSPDQPSTKSVVCPITDLRGSLHSFAALRPCGHVLSMRAIQQMTDQSCPVCNQLFAKEDVIPLNGTPDQQAELRAQLLLRKPAKSTKQLKRKGLWDEPGVLHTTTSEKARKLSEASISSKLKGVQQPAALPPSPDPIAEIGTVWRGSGLDSQDDSDKLWCSTAGSLHLCLLMCSGLRRSDVSDLQHFTVFSYMATGGAQQFPVAILGQSSIPL
ncbi:hypothetical protein WJX74_007445 [Apatococcus lobatus]|uniref:Replication termination factor 2 n=1 Tax=Apatococcus lobatus TaxID=904363 RepID=A0AAW1RXP5_9CHLO